MNVSNKYELYLQSPEFADLRMRVFERDGYKCVCCGSENYLQAHHLTYMHIYHENDDELVCVCRKCHETFHILDNRRQYIEEKYREDLANSYAELHKERTETQQKIIEEIKTEYLKQDYAKNGNLDMCSWSILNPIIEHKRKKHKFDGYINKTELRDWFFYRRCELFMRCIDKGLSIKQVRKGTKFDDKYLAKWYKREILEAKLNEEREINKLKEDVNNEEY